MSNLVEDSNFEPKELSKLLTKYSDFEPLDFEFQYDDISSLFIILKPSIILARYNIFKDNYFSDYFQDLKSYSNSQIHDLEKKIDDLDKKIKEYSENHYITAENIYTEHDEYDSMCMDSGYYQTVLHNALLYKEIDSKFKEIDNFIEGLKNDSDEVFRQSMMELLVSEFGIESANNFDYAKLYGSGFNFNVDFKNYNFNSNGSFDILNVFYLSSYSFFDSDSNNFFYTDDLKKHIFLSESSINTIFMDGSFIRELIKDENLISRDESINPDELNIKTIDLDEK